MGIISWEILSNCTVVDWTKILKFVKESMKYIEKIVAGFKPI